MSQNGIKSFNMTFEIENGRVIEAAGRYNELENDMDIQFTENGKAPVDFEEETLQELYKLFFITAKGIKQTIDQDIKHGPEDSLVLDGGEVW